jgi:hypothetical protein
MAKNIDPTKIDLQWFGDGEDTLTLEQVKEFLIQNKEKPEIVSLFSELNPRPELTVDEVRPFLETKEGKELIQPYGDKRVTEALKTYKNGNFEAEVKARVAAKLLELNPGETPEQKRIRELEEKDVNRDKEWAQKELRSQIEKLAFKEQVDPEFISGINFGSIEESALYIKNLKARDEVLKNKVTNELLASGYKPKAGKGQDENKIDLSKITTEQAIELEMKGELDKQILSNRE